MIWAEYYQYGVLTDDLIPMCGIDSFAVIDGRLNRANQIAKAKTNAEMINNNLGKQIVAFRICRGDAAWKDCPKQESGFYYV